MPREGSWFGSVVGISTIASAVFAAGALWITAADSDWVRTTIKPRIEQVAAKLADTRPGTEADVKLRGPLVDAARSTDLSGGEAGKRTIRSASRRAKRPTRSTRRARRTNKPRRRRTVSIFAVAKDIPLPTHD